MSAIGKVKNQAQKRYYAKNKEKYQAYGRAYYHANPEKARANTIKRKYHITEGEVAEILEEQGQQCPICKRPYDGPSKEWHIDHDHETLFIRSVLCHGCNVGIGHLREDPKIIRAALAYVEKFARINASH